MNTKTSTIENEKIAAYAKAMGHPIRIEILKFLAARNSCYFGKIHDELPIAKATVSQHLKVLKDAGLIKGEINPPYIRYCIDKTNWEEAHQLLSAFFQQDMCSGECQ